MNFLRLPELRAYRQRAMSRFTRIGDAAPDRTVVPARVQKRQPSALAT